MFEYPKTALKRVETMSEIAAKTPDSAISFQGAPGANSHLACQKYDADAPVLPCFNFEDAIDAVKEARAGQAMIPIENSQHGRVADIHFLLPESGLSIVAEIFLPIHHCLMALGEGPFTSVYSHPQALGQCRTYTRANGMNSVSYPDTAGAAAYVAEMGNHSMAAIAPKFAADLYGLKLIAENIEDAAHNMTRFVVLAREPRLPDPGEQVMTTFTFEVKNIPAALYKAMGGFATNSVNMTKLESYQRGGHFSATEFYADIEGSPDDPAVARAMEELQFHTKWVRLLGTYPQGRTRELAAD